MQTRRRFKQQQAFQDRLAEHAARFRAAAQELPSGRDRDVLLQRAQQVETASDIDKWLSSPGLRPPT